MARWNTERLRRVARGILADDPASCAHAVRELGPLSVCLTPQVLDQAARHPSRPPWVKPSQFVADDEIRILIAWREPPEFPLRPAFPLPLRWRRGADDPGLPESLLDLAQGIRSTMGIEEFGLCRSTAFETIDMSLAGLQLGSESAWPALCAQLCLRRQNLRNRPEVTATAIFDPNEGPRPVERGSLTSKVEAAADAGVTWLFVAPADRRKAESAAGQRLNIGVLNASTAPMEMLEPMLAVLEAPPGPGSPLERRIEYYQHLHPWNREGAQDYYVDQLLGELVRRCADTHAVKFRDLRGGTLVSMLSTNPENLLFSVAVLRPRRLLALHSDASGPDHARVRRILEHEELRETEVECRSFGSMDDDSYLSRIHELLQSVGDAQGPLVLDVTPGPKPVAILMTRTLSRAHGIVYLQTKTHGRHYKPGTETLVRLERFI